MIQRNVSRYIQSCMENYFSVAIFGPRQCGKTTLVRGLYPDFSYANLEDMNTLSKLSAVLDVQPYHFFLPVQNSRQPGKSELLSAFSDDVLNQISAVFRETMERYK